MTMFCPGPYKIYLDHYSKLISRRILLCSAFRSNNWNSIELACIVFLSFNNKLFPDKQLAWQMAWAQPAWLHCQPFHSFIYVKHMLIPHSPFIIGGVGGLGGYRRAYVWPSVSVLYSRKDTNGAYLDSCITGPDPVIGGGGGQPPRPMG